MSFAEDFFGEKVVREYLKGFLSPIEVFGKIPSSPSANLVTLSFDGHTLKTESGEVATKALTFSGEKGSEYTLIDSAEKVVPDHRCIVLNSLIPAFDGAGCALRGNLYNRPPIRDGEDKKTSPVAFFEIGWNQAFWPTKVECEGEKIKAVRGFMFRLKGTEDPKP